jgi:hypothetical protein
MTGPAILGVRLDSGNNTGMTSDAVRLHELFAALRKLDRFVEDPRMKKNHIPGTFDALPDEVIDDIVVGQVTIDALNGAMHTRHEPCLILIVHDMAAVAEFGGRGHREEPRRSGRGNYADGNHDHRQYDHQPFAHFKYDPLLRWELWGINVSSAVGTGFYVSVSCGAAPNPIGAATPIVKWRDRLIVKEIFCMSSERPVNGRPGNPIWFYAIAERA